jgi:hypothetical protein
MLFVFIMKQFDEGFYTRQESRLLKDFDLVVKQVQPPITLRYGSERAAYMVKQAREEYLHLLPELPYVGGEQPFTQFVIASGWFLALYRVMRAQGADIHEIGETTFLLSRTYLEHVPGFARRLLGYMTFSPRYLRKLERRAAESREHPYPRGYVFTYVPGDGINFDFGVDYHQCATWTLYQEQGATELTPYLCACDYLYSEMLGWGLIRTTTLGEGGDRCDFRFKRGGPTLVKSTVMDYKILK